MKTRNIVIWSVVGVVILLILVVLPITYYNRFISQGEAIDAQWAQVENQLKRRNDLIPNLVNSVKGYMGHEQEIFTHVADARSKLIGARTMPEKIEAAQGLDRALGQLLAVVERYPELKAIESFNRLMDELAGTENRLAVERKRYNDKVREYNVTIRRFPGNIFASIFAREPGIYFEVPEAEERVPEVRF
jgi:LemA protein